jgi:hypothetical protein
MLFSLSFFPSSRPGPRTEHLGSKAVDFEAAPLYRGNQGGGRGNVIGELVELFEQTRDRILELLDPVPHRDQRFGF